MRTILVFLVLAGALWAQQGPTETELARFDQFLDSHPQVRSELIKDPKLIDNENFIINHPDLADFLHTHPGVKGQILSNPQAFMTRERAFEKSEATPQPHMQSALEHLRQAQKELEQAEHDKGGHREKALQLTKDAEAQVQAGMNYDVSHEKQK